MNEKIPRKPYAPECPPEPEEKPVCTVHERCRDCAYPAHGFICWHRDGSCMRTMAERSKANVRQRA